MVEPRGTDHRADKLAELERRIGAVRDARAPKPRKVEEKYTAMSMAWRMIFELMASIAIGSAMGWGLDLLLGSLPLFLIVFALLGCASGFRMMMRSAEDIQRRQAAAAAQEDGTHGRNGR